MKTTLSISIKLKGTFHNAAQPPFINIEALENLIQLRNLLVSEDKYVLVRSFPGPVGSPILSVGGLSTPQLPQHYHYDNPTDNLAVQQAIKDLYQFPLAVYLCAFAGEKVFYTYSVWYDVRQHVPGESLHTDIPVLFMLSGRNNPEQSQWPTDFDEYLKMNPGKF